jgi:hypothetical protein
VAEKATRLSRLSYGNRRLYTQPADVNIVVSSLSLSFSLLVALSVYWRIGGKGRERESDVVGFCVYYNPNVE